MQSRESLARLREHFTNELFRITQAGEHRKAMARIDAVTARITGDDNRAAADRLFRSLDAETDAASLAAIKKYVRSRLNPRLRSAGLSEIR